MFNPTTILSRIAYTCVFPLPVSIYASQLSSSNSAIGEAATYSNNDIPLERLVQHFKLVRPGTHDFWSRGLRRGLNLRGRLDS